jgi:hypothetical protein
VSGKSSRKIRSALGHKRRCRPRHRQVRSASDCGIGRALPSFKPASSPVNAIAQGASAVSLCWCLYQDRVWRGRLQQGPGNCVLSGNCLRPWRLLSAEPINTAYTTSDQGPTWTGTTPWTRPLRREVSRT